MRLEYHFVCLGFIVGYLGLPRASRAPFANKSSKLLAVNKYELTVAVLGLVCIWTFEQAFDLAIYHLRFIDRGNECCVKDSFWDLVEYLRALVLVEGGFTYLIVCGGGTALLVQWVGLALLRFGPNHMRVSLRWLWRRCCEGRTSCYPLAKVRQLLNTGVFIYSFLCLDLQLLDMCWMLHRHVLVDAGLLVEKQCLVETLNVFLRNIKLVKVCQLNQEHLLLIVFNLSLLTKIVYA